SGLQDAPGDSSQLVGGRVHALPPRDVTAARQLHHVSSRAARGTGALRSVLRFRRGGSLTMPTTRTLAVAALVVGLFAVVLACGVATDGAAADKIPPSVTRLMGGWEQEFTLEWSVGPDREGSGGGRGFV